MTTTTVGKLRSMLREINPDLPVVFAVGEYDNVEISAMILHETDQLVLKLSEYDHWGNTDDPIMRFQIVT